MRERASVAPVCRLTCCDRTILSRRKTCCLACVLGSIPCRERVPAEAEGGREKPAGKARLAWRASSDGGLAPKGSLELALALRQRLVVLLLVLLRLRLPHQEVCRRVRRRPRPPRWALRRLLLAVLLLLLAA